MFTKEQLENLILDDAYTVEQRQGFFQSLSIINASNDTNLVTPNKSKTSNKRKGNEVFKSEVPPNYEKKMQEISAQVIAADKYLGVSLDSLTKAKEATSNLNACLKKCLASHSEADESIKKAKISVKRMASIMPLPRTSTAQKDLHFDSNSKQNIFDVSSQDDDDNDIYSLGGDGRGYLSNPKQNRYNARTVRLDSTTAFFSFTSNLWMYEKDSDPSSPVETKHTLRKVPNWGYAVALLLTSSLGRTMTVQMTSDDPNMSLIQKIWTSNETENVSLNVDGADILMRELHIFCEVIKINLDLCGLFCAQVGPGPIYHDPTRNAILAFLLRGAQNEEYFHFVLINSVKSLFLPMKLWTGMSWGRNVIDAALAKDEEKLKGILGQYIVGKSGVGVGMTFVGAWQIAQKRN